MPGFVLKPMSMKKTDPCPNHPPAIFDSHCHLDDRAFDDDLDPVIARAEAAGVKALMTVGIDPESCRRSVELAERYERVFAALGIHPHDARNCSQPILDRLAELSRHTKVKAWGEIGLDFNRMYSPRRDQEKWFVCQLETAIGLDLPMIFHERDSGGRFYQLLAERWNSGCRGVVHCFSGDRRDLERYLALGLHIGVTGIITIKQRGAPLRELVKSIPLDRLLIETDAPYLTPTPERNKHRRNEPAFVARVLEKLSRVLELAPEKVAEATWQNTCRLYGIGPADMEPDP